MSDTKESMPAQPRTKELPAMTDRALLEDLRNVVKEGFSELRADIQLVSTDVTVVKERVRLVEERVKHVEDRQTNQSVRVKGESEVNLKQDAAIAQILEKVTALEERPDTSKVVLDKLTEIGKTPTGQKVVGALVTVLLLSLALLAAKLQSQVDAIEKKPATVQPAPTVYLPVPVDGGAR